MIDKIEYDKLDPKVFLKKYFIAEVPVIITGVSSGSRLDLWSYEEFEELANNSSVVKDRFWYQPNISVGKVDKAIPEFVSSAHFSNLCRRRKENVRLWSNKQGDRTLLHLDANGLYVFNFQARGEKSWRIYSPDTPFQMYSFTNIPYLKYNERVPPDIERFETKFTLREGDLLFLPSYWFHRVETISDWALNINWVGTLKKSKNSKALLRENKILKIALIASHISILSKFIDLTCGSMQKGYIDSFGGDKGRDFIKRRVTGVSFLSAITAVLSELRGLFKLAKDLKKIKKYSKTSLN